MNKTTSVNIGGVNYFIEEGAYAKLSSYLESIQGHFAESTDGGEIVSDIENRIAEKFSEKTKGRKEAVVTIRDVEDVIAQLGNPNDIGGVNVTDKDKDTKTDTNAEAEDASNRKTARRLMRDPDGALIGGVASGLGAYFGLDPVIVRVAFVALLFLRGFAIPLYLIFWLIMPEAKTTADKMEMRGEEFTVKNLSETVRDRANEVRSTGRVQKFIRSCTHALGKIVRLALWIFSGLVGVLLLIFSIMGAAFVTFFAATAIFNTNVSYLRYPLHIFAAHPLYYVLVLLGYAAILIPLALGGLLGAVIITKKKISNRKTVLGLIGAWIIIMIAGGVFLLRAIPEFQADLQNSQENQIGTRNFSVGSFSGVALVKSATYRFVHGDSYSVIASGTTAGLDGISVTSDNGVLRVEPSGNRTNCIISCPREAVTIEITAPQFSKATIGDSRVTLEKVPVDLGTIIVEANGDATVEDLSGSALDLELADGASAELDGSLKNLSAKIGDDASLGASDLSVQDATLVIGRYGDADVNPSNSLHYTKDATSELHYLPASSLHVIGTTVRSEEQSGE